MGIPSRLAPGPLLLVGLGAAAATFTVDNPSDAIDLVPGDGLCQGPLVMGGGGRGRCTLRAAVMEANALPGADLVLLPPGTYGLSLGGPEEDAAAAGDLDVTEDLTIAGSGQAVTVIDGLESTRILEVGDLTSLELLDLALVGGRAATADAFVGGAVEVRGQLLVDGSRLEDNVANSGGALFVLSGGAATVRDSLLIGNGAADLGFTNAQGSAIRVQGALLMERSAVLAGADLGTAPAALSGNCTGAFTVRDSTVAGNDAGISTFNCDATLTHVTIAGNPGPGLTLGSFDGSHPRIVTNSIIAGNSADCLNVAGSSFSHSLDTDGTCNLVSAPGSFSAVDPVLLPLGDYGGPTPTRPPDPATSPVVDAALTTACTATDQRGFPRGLDGNADGVPGCDLGAVEIVPELVFADGFEERP